MISSPNIHQKTAPASIQQLNETITNTFLETYQSPAIRKTHLFEGRYENIYMDADHIPELSQLIVLATQYAEQVLNKKNIRAGYWFNFMPPGSVTNPHRHDDDDELLSGVYYLSVAKNSGNLVLQDKTASGEFKSVEIAPQEGLFVFFKPDVIHEVTENKSGENRLSIGMNFGVPG